jgi:hypothetical protein
MGYYMNWRLCIGITAILLLQTKAVCQSSVISTNFTFFKTNIVNDLTNLNAAMKAYRQGLINKGEITLVTLATLNDEPITFYGKLEDQFSNAVGNASISFDVRINNGLESTVKRGQVFSDAKGFFIISGYHGESLGFMPHKEGYVTASTDTYLKYSHLEQGWYVPNSKQPDAIRMWKVQGVEPLMGIGKKYNLHYTNAPICFDLLARTMVPKGGDIRITVSRPPGIISERNRQFWSVKIEVNDGGLMDSSPEMERITYFAPERGYQPSKTISSSDRLPEGGTGGFRTRFFVKSRNGQVYSKLRFDFMINEKPDDLMYFEFAGIANTNFSRNWEGASGTYLKPGFLY